MSAILSIWAWIAILIAFPRSEENRTRHCRFHESALMTFGASRANNIASVWVFVIGTSSLSNFCWLWKPARFSQNTRCGILFRPGSVDTFLHSVIFSSNQSPVTSVGNWAELSCRAFHTVRFIHSRTSCVVNFAGTILIKPVIVGPMGAVDVVSACLVHTILTRWAPCAVSLAYVCKPAAWTVHREFILRSAELSSWAYSAIARWFRVAGVNCIITWFTHFHSTKFSTWTLVTFGTVLFIK